MLSHSLFTPALSSGYCYCHHLWMGKRRLREVRELFPSCAASQCWCQALSRGLAPGLPVYICRQHTHCLSSLLPSRQVVLHVSGRSCGLLVCISEYVCWVFKFRHEQHLHLWGSVELQQTLHFTGIHREHRCESRVFNNQLASSLLTSSGCYHEPQTTLPGVGHSGASAQASRSPRRQLVIIILM